MTPQEAAPLFGVGSATFSNRTYRAYPVLLEEVRFTPGGHRRWPLWAIRAALETKGGPRAQR